MRRKDREITDKNRIIEIMEKCQTVSLSMCKDNMPYGVIVNFGLITSEKEIEICFHCAKEGKK